MVSGGGPVRDRAGARGPSRRARRRAGAASGRVRGRTAEGRETAAAEGRGRRAEGGERPGSRRAPPRRNRALCPRLRRVGGRAPGRPPVRSKSPANSGGRAPPSPAPSPLRIAAWPGHVSGKPGPPAPGLPEEQQEPGAASPEPSARLSSKCAPPRPLLALGSLTLAPPRFWADAGSHLCEFPSFTKFSEEGRTPHLTLATPASGGSSRADRVLVETVGRLVRPGVVVGVCGRAHPASQAGGGGGGCPLLAAPHQVFHTSLSLRPVQGFPSEKPRRSVRARVGLGCRLGKADLPAPPWCVGRGVPAAPPFPPFQVCSSADQPGAASCLFSAPAAPGSPPSTSHLAFFIPPPPPAVAGRR